MIELSRTAEGTPSVGFAGDTLNTAVYLRRLGLPTAYMTALGKDAWSNDMRAAWARESIDTSLVLTHPNRAPGLYAISTDSRGERSFTYWRDQSAAREFFQCEGAQAACAVAGHAKLFYLSGISLAILPPSDRRALSKIGQTVRRGGGIVAFDPNYRARLWPDPEACKLAILNLLPNITYAMPSFDDEATLWGDTTPEETYARWKALGVPDVVVKNGANGAFTSEGWVPALPIADPSDTTGAGDSFNAGWLFRRLVGDRPTDAAKFAARLAGRVVRYPGAIIPVEAMLNDEATS